MEIERYVEHQRSRSTNGGLSSSTTLNSQTHKAERTHTKGTSPEKETDGWVVIGLDRSYIGARLIPFEYTPLVLPAQIIEAANLQSREQLDELVTAGIQGLWDDLPMETRKKYKQAEAIHFAPEIDPLIIIKRGKQALARRRKEGSMRANKIERALRVEPRNDYTDWKVRDARDYPYGASFIEVLPGFSLSQLVETSKQKTGKALVLDFMGYGQVLQNLPLTGGLAVALHDPRSEDVKQRDAKRNIDFVDGNVFRRSTWNKMQKWLDRQETDDKKFDLILSRPVRGLDHLTDHRGVNIVLLQRGWKMLSSHNGILLTQFLEQIFNQSLIDKWVKLLNQTEGIKTSYSFRKNPACEPIAFRPALAIVKGEEAPEKLPLL